jgi:hypothetical protein
MKYIFIAYLFSVISIHILHYKLSQTLNSLTKKIKVDTLCGTEGVKDKISTTAQENCSGGKTWAWRATLVICVFCRN